MNKNIVLSDIDNVLLSRLKFEAENRGTDLKTLIISMIRKSIGIDKIYDNKIQYHDLDHLSGTWTIKEYNDFLSCTAELDKIDNELWK